MRRCRAGFALLEYWSPIARPDGRSVWKLDKARAYPCRGVRYDRHHVRRPAARRLLPVARPDGTPVPGLYAAGGAGTVWGPFTHSGGGLTDALVFGRLAGQHAAQSH
jgi:hypothetical protein